MPTPAKLSVFLCHAKEDKPAVRELYQKLAAEGWIDPWLDEEKLLPGQDWDMEIEKAVRASHAFLVLLSQKSVTKEGYVHAEIRFALNVARTKPDETIYMIPLRLDDCQVPVRLQLYQYVDYYPKERETWAYHKLLASLETRARSLNIPVKRRDDGPKTEPREQVEGSKTGTGRLVERLKPEPSQPVDNLGKQRSEPQMPLPSIAAPKSILEIGLDRAEWGGIEFVKVPAGPFLMGSREGNELAFDNEYPQHSVDIPYDYWMARFPVTNEQYALYVAQGNHPVGDWQRKRDYPVVYVSWRDAMNYCKWLNETLQGRLPQGLALRLPTEAEWEKAARGAESREWPWGDEFDKNKCNSDEGGKGGTTPVGLYSPHGDSPYGCADMVGNVWEWCHSLYQPYPCKVDNSREVESATGRRVLRGGSFYSNRRYARCAFRYDDLFLNPSRGFRVVASVALSE